MHSTWLRRHQEFTLRRLPVLSGRSRAGLFLHRRLFGVAVHIRELGTAVDLGGA